MRTAHARRFGTGGEAFAAQRTHRLQQCVARLARRGRQLHQAVPQERGNLCLGTAGQVGAQAAHRLGRFQREAAAQHR
ncbi:MAG TPA: hypothetical protein VET87_05285, partial [Rubrivivax sp.]|nr:hypothetical protein [Rubrivivax sp.]